MPKSPLSVVLSPFTMFFRKGRRADQGPPPAMPVVVQPVIQPAPGPLPQDLVPPVVQQVVNEGMGVAARNKILAAIVPGSELDTSPLAPVDLPMRPRSRGMSAQARRNISLLGHLQALRKIYSDARRRGGWVRNQEHFSEATAIAEFQRRIPHVHQRVPANDTRWVDRKDMTVFTPKSLSTTRQFTVPRVGKTSGKMSDVYHECDQFRSDTQWVTDVYAITRGLADKCGATEVQARYIASCSVLETLKISYGLNPGHVIPGYAPEDLGFDIPADIPAEFHYNP